MGKAPGKPETHFIELENVEVMAPLGYYPEEQRTGNRFLVNIRVETDFSGTETDDDIGRTLNYEHLVSIIRSEMTPPARLIEQVACRIRNRILELPGVTGLVRIEIKKQHPSLELKTGSANIIIEYRADV